MVLPVWNIVQALAVSLSSDIPVMVSGLSNTGLEVNVNMEDLTSKEAILC